MNQAQDYLKDAEYYLRKGDTSKAQTRQQWANTAMSKSKTRQRWADEANEKARTRMRWAEEALRKAN